MAQISDGVYKPKFKDYIDFAKGAVKSFIKGGAFSEI